MGSTRSKCADLLSLYLSTGCASSRVEGGQPDPGCTCAGTDHPARQQVRGDEQDALHRLHGRPRPVRPVKVHSQTVPLRQEDRALQCVLFSSRSSIDRRRLPCLADTLCLQPAVLFCLSSRHDYGSPSYHLGFLRPVDTWTDLPPPLFPLLLSTTRTTSSSSRR